MSQFARSPSPGVHLANLGSLVYNMLLTILSLLPLAILTMPCIWMLAGSATRKDISILLGIGMAVFAVLHIYVVSMLYNFWSYGNLPYVWALVYSNVILGMAVVGLLLFAGVWRVLRNILLSVMSVAEESTVGKDDIGDNKERVGVDVKKER